jgi:hypothetical protein
VHGSWDTAFVQGGHDYLIPVTPERGPDGRGRPETYDWPPNAREVGWDRLRDLDVDVVVLQRPEEVRLAARWLGREPGREVPAIYVEHNAPAGEVPNARHPVAGRTGIHIVHVTHFNALMWDNGVSPVAVIEHGVPDPGHRYSGEWPRAAVVVNEPLRRWRVTGTDLLAPLSRAAPIDVFGMKVTGLPQRLGLDPAAIWAFENPPQDKMHAELARRRVYVHPIRWTSLGLSLIEAMLLGMPVVALATTAVPETVPAGAGVVSTRVEVLADAIRGYVSDPSQAAQAGRVARAAALARHGLPRFLNDWDRVLTEVTR